MVALPDGAGFFGPVPALRRLIDAAKLLLFSGLTKQIK